MRLRGVYWLKRVTDRIVTLPLSLVLDHEDVLGDHIVRDPPSAADLTAGRPGALRSIDVAATNLGRIDASGVDGQVAEVDEELEVLLPEEEDAGTAFLFKG